MKKTALFATTVALFATSPLGVFAQTSATSAYSAPVSPPNSHIAPSTYKFTTPLQIQPASVVDQRLIRKTIYTDPMHCDTSRLLTPLQIEAAEQACAERFFNVDHSG